MPRKRSTLSKNSDFVYQIIDSVMMAISEHKWKDASLLLPSVIALLRRKISPYFIWKILHAIMSSTNIPLALQIQILQVTLKSSVKNYDLILDILAYKFEAMDEQDIETLYESINESQKHKESRDLLRSLCLSYYALYHYLKWKRLSNVQNETKLSMFKMNYPELMDEEKRVQLGKLSLKAHAHLNKVYSLFQSSDVADTKGEYHEKSVPCEWLLGPLLDINVYTKMENTCKNNRKVKNDFCGLELIENYVRNHHLHIPALRTFYFYLVAHHSEEKVLIFEVLEKIVSLSPDSSLVLQYILNLLSKESIVIGSSQERNRSKKTKLQGCHLGSVNLETLVKCIKLLRDFIEYRMWRKDVRAWKALKDILILFHESWINCWECDHCISSRKRVEHFSETLSSWPHFIWHETQIQLFTLEDSELLVYMGYTSFVLGYSEMIAKKAIECLENLECHDEARNLLDLMRQKGSYMRDFLIYLLQQRKKRNFPENQDTTEIKSGSYSVKNTKVMFSSSKFARKNYFRHANNVCLSTVQNEVCKNFPKGVSAIDLYSRNKTPSEKDGEIDCNYNSSICVSSIINDNDKNGSKISFGRKYISSKNKEFNKDIEENNVQINGNISEMEGHFKKREPVGISSKQMGKNVESCSKNISKINTIENEESRNSFHENTPKWNSKIQKEIKFQSNISTSEIRPLSCTDSANAEKPKISLKSNKIIFNSKIMFGRKRKLSNEDILRGSKKHRSK